MLRRPPTPTLCPYTTLFRSCAGAKCVVAYYASFERDCLLQLAEVVPQLSSEMIDIAARLVDLLPVVRNHVYHRSEEHTSELQSHVNLVCRLLLEKKNNADEN